MDSIKPFVEYSALLLEALGVGVITLGALYSIIDALVLSSKKAPNDAVFRIFRQKLGGGILLGLEFLVAGDIINTVAVEPTFRSVGVLAVIVLIRTFLSFTLEVEMTGQWPWQGKKEEPKPSHHDRTT